MEPGDREGRLLEGFLVGGLTFPVVAEAGLWVGMRAVRAWRADPWDPPVDDAAILGAALYFLSPIGAGLGGLTALFTKAKRLRTRIAISSGAAILAGWAASTLMARSVDVLTPASSLVTCVLITSFALAGAAVGVLTSLSLDGKIPAFEPSPGSKDQGPKEPRDHGIPEGIVK